VRPSFFESLGPPPGTHTAVYVGNLAHREIDYLLEISEMVRAQIPDFRLAVYGDAPEARRAELARLIDERSLGDAVHLEPPVKPVEVPGVLARADVLLLPRSRGEFSAAGFPNKLGEYLSSARPVVVSRVGEIPSYLTDRESARLVDPDDCEAFATAVVEVLTDSAAAAEMGVRGRAVARELSRSDVVARRVVGFVAGLPQGLGGRTRSTPLRYARRAGRLARSYVPQVKRAIVRTLRLFHLKPPAPESERPGTNP